MKLSKLAIVTSVLLTASVSAGPINDALYDVIEYSNDQSFLTLDYSTDRMQQVEQNIVELNASRSRYMARHEEYQQTITACDEKDGGKWQFFNSPRKSECFRARENISDTQLQVYKLEQGIKNSERVLQLIEAGSNKLLTIDLPKTKKSIERSKVDAVREQMGPESVAQFEFDFARNDDVALVCKEQVKWNPRGDRTMDYLKCLKVKLTAAYVDIYNAQQDKQK